jgi:hypothetical protein
LKAISILLLTKMDINVFLYLFLGYLLTKHVLIDIVYVLIQEGIEKKTVDDKIEEDKKKEDKIEEENPAPKKEIKYEDKYLEKLRQMPTDYVFTKEELESQEKLFPEFKKKLLQEYDEEMIALEEAADAEDAGEYDVDDDKSLKESRKKFFEKVDKPVTDQDVKQKVKEHIILERLKGLANSKVMEMTPLGNVVMSYNVKKEAFDFYSDSTIPYRYLEPVCRKYVLTFHCWPLYVDIEKELEKEKDRLEKERIEKEKEKEREKLNPTPPKKNVFAKFKNYNKATGHVVKGAPPKNSLPAGVKLVKLDDGKKKDEPLLLKNRANKYSYLGRFSNYMATQKVDRTVVDKKLKLTFADFKRMKK